MEIDLDKAGKYRVLGGSMTVEAQRWAGSEAPPRILGVREVPTFLDLKLDPSLTSLL